MPSVTPRLGRTSILVLALLAAGWFVAWRQFHDVAKSGSHAADEIRLYGLIGICYGVAAGSCWIASAIGGRIPRFLARALVVVLCAFVKHTLSSGSLVRAGLDVAGICLIQVVLLFLMRVPSWKPPSGFDQRSAGRTPLDRRQFAIGDVVLLTGAFAVVLGLAIRYAPPIEAERYWTVLAVAWIVIPAAGSCLARSLTSRTWVSTVAYGLAAAVFAGLMVHIASAAEPRAEFIPQGQSPYPFFVPYYGGLIAGFVLAFALIALAGRLQASNAFRFSATKRATDRLE